MFIEFIKQVEEMALPITQVTHMRNKNSNIQGRSLYVIKVIFHIIRIYNCS